jgi:hypothetical protein
MLAATTVPPTWSQCLAALALSDPYRGELGRLGSSKGGRQGGHSGAPRPGGGLWQLLLGEDPVAGSGGSVVAEDAKGALQALTSSIAPQVRTLAQEPSPWCALLTRITCCTTCWNVTDGSVKHIAYYPTW